MLLNSDDDTFLQTFNCHFCSFVICGFYLYSSSWSCIWDVCIWKDYTRVKLSNILTMVLQEKAYSVSGCDLFSKWSWLWTSDTLFHLRGVSLQGGGQGTALLDGHQLTWPLKRLCSSPPNHWVAQQRWKKMSRCWPGTPWPHRCDEAHMTQFTVTGFKLIFRDMWIRTTSASHGTNEKWSLNWLCFVFSPFSPEHCPQKSLCILYRWPICPLS